MLLLLTAFYVFGYGVARWGKFVVMKAYYVKEQEMVVRHTGPGWDVRNDWRGKLKNRLNPLVFACFCPLCLAEDAVRGASTQIVSI